MDLSSIQISGCEISAVMQDDQHCRIVLSRALIIKTMTGSVEKTLWWQAGELVIGDAIIQDGSPAITDAAVCERGDIDDNEYTYRNMIPIPLESRGRIRVELFLRDHEHPLIVEGSTIALELHDTPKYIEHLRPES